MKGKDIRHRKFKDNIYGLKEIKSLLFFQDMSACLPIKDIMQ